MDYALICTWLGLPPDAWPPDHYTLLGLPLGERDVTLIEQHVHDRLTRLRPYQLNHPDQVTEAMNRLAQAFTCLTDPEAKEAYDTALQLRKPAEATEVVTAPADVTPGVAAAAEEVSDPLAWLFGPWNQAVTPSVAEVQADWQTAPPPARVPALAVDPEDSSPVGNGSAAATEAPVAEKPAEPVDPHREAAHLSVPARRGLGTKRALYHRIAITRRLLAAWEGAGKLLSKPNRRLTRVADAHELTRELDQIRKLLPSFPPILGRAGQPGYFVIILAQQPMIVPTFRTLLSSQREELARDWTAGRDLLQSHLRFLRQEVRAIRRHNRWGRFVRASRAFLADHPGTVLLVLALVALGLSIWFGQQGGGLRPFR